MTWIDVWSARRDPTLPVDVLQRLLDRQAAARAGRDPGVCPPEDRPYLARHVRHGCAAHDELIVHRGGQWEHLTDGTPCPPPVEADQDTEESLM
jgi:hypothetical protein